MAGDRADRRDSCRRDTVAAGRYSRAMKDRRRDSESSGSARITAIAAILIPR